METFYHGTTRLFKQFDMSHAFEGDGKVFFFEGTYTEYEINKAARLGTDEIKRPRYRKLMED